MNLVSEINEYTALNEIIRNKFSAILHYIRNNVEHEAREKIDKLNSGCSGHIDIRVNKIWIQDSVVYMSNNSWINSTFSINLEEIGGWDYE